MSEIKLAVAGLEIVGDLQSDSTMVQRVLDFKDELDHVVKEAFDSSKSLLESCKEGFEHFINVRCQPLYSDSLQLKD